MVKNSVTEIYPFQGINMTFSSVSRSTARFQIVVQYISKTNLSTTAVRHKSSTSAFQWANIILLKTHSPGQHWQQTSLKQQSATRKQLRSMLNLKQRAFPKQITAFHCLLLHSKGFQAEIIQISCHQLRESPSCTACRTSTGCRTMPHMLVRLRFILTGQRFCTLYPLYHCLTLKENVLKHFGDYVSSC